MLRRADYYMERAHPTLLQSRKRGVFVQSALYRLDAAGSVDLMLVDVVAGRGREGGVGGSFLI